MTIKNYRDLEVWEYGRRLVRTVYELTVSFPASELYGLTSQMRRAAVSVPANIAEGHSRNSTRDFIYFLSIAIGSLAELDTYITLTLDLKYISDQQAEAIGKQIISLQKRLHSLRGALKSKTVESNPQSPITNPQNG